MSDDLDAIRFEAAVVAERKAIVAAIREAFLMDVPEGDDYRVDAEALPVVEAIGETLEQVLEVIAARGPDHAHQWIDTRNEVIMSGEMCVVCREVRAGPVAEQLVDEAVG